MVGHAEIVMVVYAKSVMMGPIRSYCNTLQFMHSKNKCRANKFGYGGTSPGCSGGTFEKLNFLAIDGGEICEVAQCIFIHMGVITNGNKDQNHET